MKYILPFAVFFMALLLFSCQDNSRIETRVIATPVLMDKQEVRASIAVETEQSITASGKIYTYLNYVFVNDKNKGVHVIDNRVPSSPQKINFLKILGNFDIEVRNNILYADSFSDLVLFDISDIDAINYLTTYEDVFSNFGFSRASLQEGVFSIDYGDYDAATSFIVDWTYEEIQVEIDNGGNDDFTVLESAASNDSGSITGQGGSFARFKIVDTYLYAVDFSDLYVFDIATPDTATPLGQQGIGWEIETIFNQDDYLYIGSQTGMLIFNIEDRTSPYYESEIAHWRGCDPVVVKGDYAYLTLRGGNVCGQDLSVLEVIDVTDKSNPFIAQSYAMQEPYGLGIKDNTLYVSDGPNGMHIYDISDPINLISIALVDGVNVFDVIPQQDKLIAIANNVLLQYEYDSVGLSLISEFNIN